MTFTPDTKGRGAWTRTGGLLPDPPGGTGGIGYYRLAITGEAPVGSTWARGSDTSDAAHAVNAGTRALQVLLGITGADVDGWFGPQTDRAVRAAQTRLGLIVDGIAGPATLRKLLTPGITAAATATRVPTKVLGGIATHESMLDPAAVGYTTPHDHGLMQINLDAFDEDSAEHITYEQAMDPNFSIPWTARRIRGQYDQWVGKTTADPWEVAILYHNSPYNSLRLAKSGVYPSTQAQQYVASVLSAW
jgi:peptidoglycan hydrolase-like protein with peptidoglycan-binding domain